MPLWASWLKDFDILNIFYDELKIEKMAKFEILIATNGLIICFSVSLESSRTTLYLQPGDRKVQTMIVVPKDY